MEEINTTYDGILQYVSQNEWEIINQIKDRFYLLNSEWDYMLTRNDNFIRHTIIDKMRCPWCFERLDFIADGEYQGNVTGYLECKNKHELY